MDSELNRMRSRALVIEPAREKAREEFTKIKEELEKIPLYKRIQMACKIKLNRWFMVDRKKIEVGKPFNDVRGKFYVMDSNGTIRRAVPKMKYDRTGNDLKRYKRLGLLNKGVNR